MLRSLTLFQLWTYLRAVCMRALHVLVILSLIMPNLTGLAEAASPASVETLGRHDGQWRQQRHATESSTATTGGPVTPVVDAPRVQQTLESSPVMFIENVGQFDDGAKFVVRGEQGSIFLAQDAIWVTLTEPVQSPAVEAQAQALFNLQP